MAKLTLNDLSNLENQSSAVALINANNTLTETALENTLSRDGTSPNQMGANLDMNSNRILNLPAATSSLEPLRLTDLDSFNHDGSLTFTNIPTGGTVNQALVKNSSSNFDASWHTVLGILPTGGTRGSLLAKNSDSNYDVTWEQGWHTPEMYGAVGDGVTDDKVAFQSMATAINSAGGGRIVFGLNKSYRIWNTSLLAGNSILMNLSNINGLTIDFNGGQFVVGASDFEVGVLSYVFNFGDACHCVTVNNPRIVNASYNTSTDEKGITLFNIQENGSTFIFNNIYQEYGLCGVRCSRSSSANRAYNIIVNGAYFLGVGYPLSFQKNGDDFYGFGIRTVDCWRVYFPYNVKRHFVNIQDSSHGHIDPTCLIKCYADSNENDAFNTTSDICLNYIGLPVDGVNHSRRIAVSFQQSNNVTSTGFIRNIYINADVTLGTGLTGSVDTLVDIGNKAAFDNTLDTTTRGYVIENVLITGKFNFNSESVATFSAICENGTWTGETLRNIKYSHITTQASGSTYTIRGDCVAMQSLIFEDCIFDKQLLLSNVAGGTLFLRNVKASSASGLGTTIGSVFHTGGLAPATTTTGTDTTPVTTETYICEVNIPYPINLTGIAILNGTAVAGNIKVALADSTGTIKAQSASTAASGTGAYQQLAFTSPYFANGPSKYYVLLQNDNTSNRYRSHILGNFGASKATGGTYGTFVTITPPTTFTTGQGPIADVY